MQSSDDKDGRDGYNYFTERQRLKQQHDSIITTNNSVRGTNTKTWIIAALAALFSGLTFFSQCNEGCTESNRQSQQLREGLTKQLQDSFQQIRETFEASYRHLQFQIDTFLRTTQLKDTAALRHNPIDQKHD
jgi:hypothetical protein